MNDKDLLKLLGLNDKTISIGLDDEYLQLTLEKKIDNYLKKIDEQKEKEKMISTLQSGYEEYKEKEHLIELLKSKIVISTIRDILIREGFSYKCPTCLDVSSQYGRPIQTYKKYNKNK